MVTTVELIASYINSKHGWAVAEQFESTFNGESFDEQNFNALKYIKDTINNVLKSDVLSLESQDELQEYQSKMEEYFSHVLY
jgi:hypothetical protein